MCYETFPMWSSAEDGKPAEYCVNCDKKYDGEDEVRLREQKMDEAQWAVWPCFIMDVDKAIKLILTLFTMWVVLHGFMKFLPQYATQLPLSVYTFLYELTQT